MTLTQRLTRAGLVFVLLGTVAAVLPQQSGAAIAADPCTIGGNTLKIVQGTLSSDPASPTFSQLNSTQLYTSFFNTTQDGIITVSSGTGFTNAGSESSQVTLTKSGTSGSAVLSDTFTNGTGVYNASATITY